MQKAKLVCLLVCSSYALYLSPGFNQNGYLSLISLLVVPRRHRTICLLWRLLSKKYDGPHWKRSFQTVVVWQEWRNIRSECTRRLTEDVGHKNSVNSFVFFKGLRCIKLRKMVTLESKTLQVKSAVAVAQTCCSCLNDYHKKWNVKNSTSHPNSSVSAKGAALGLCPHLDERIWKPSSSLVVSKLGTRVSGELPFYSHSEHKPVLGAWCQQKPELTSVNSRSPCLKGSAGEHVNWPINHLSQICSSVTQLRTIYIPEFIISCI